MDIWEDIKELKTARRDLRRFGLMVGGVLVAFGALVFLRHRIYYAYLLWPGAVLVALGALFPRALKHIYTAWMTAAFALGFVLSHLILTLFFFFVITPVGLVARLFGQDFLSLKLDREAQSYWIQRAHVSKTAMDYERQF